MPRTTRRLSGPDLGGLLREDLRNIARRAGVSNVVSKTKKELAASILAAAAGRGRGRGGGKGGKRGSKRGTMFGAPPAPPSPSKLRSGKRRFAEDRDRISQLDALIAREMLSVPSQEARKAIRAAMLEKAQILAASEAKRSRQDASAKKPITGVDEDSLGMPIDKQAAFRLDGIDREVKPKPYYLSEAEVRGLVGAQGNHDLMNPYSRSPQSSDAVKAYLETRNEEMRSGGYTGEFTSLGLVPPTRDQIAARRREELAEIAAQEQAAREMEEEEEEEEERIRVGRVRHTWSRLNQVNEGAWQRYRSRTALLLHPFNYPGLDTGGEEPPIFKMNQLVDYWDPDEQRVDFFRPARGVVIGIDRQEGRHTLAWEAHRSPQYRTDVRVVHRPYTYNLAMVRAPDGSYYEAVPPTVIDGAREQDVTAASPDPEDPRQAEHNRNVMGYRDEIRAAYERDNNITLRDPGVIRLPTSD